MKNIFIGFLGALIALILSAVFSRINNAIRLNRIRKSILAYLEFIAHPKLDRYIKDCTKGIRHLQQAQTSQDKTEGYDNMPMLTSEVLKSFPQNDLLIVSFTAETYSSILEFYYSIDFLRNNMPRDIYNEFSQWTNKHLEDENIPKGQKQQDHIKSCAAIGRERSDSIINIEMKISTANGLNDRLIDIQKILKGKSTIWIWKYFWRQ